MLSYFTLLEPLHCFQISNDVIKKNTQFSEKNSFLKLILTYLKKKFFPHSANRTEAACEQEKKTKNILPNIK